ncbi:MAG TPA: hypothetical protein VFX19_09160, partial [Dehalococcoidia bacterium]|nr:hypothetical protein [Dehalococcoidia bacterium]
ASVESTGMGAAYLAGIATGFWRDEAEVAPLRRVERRFEPQAGSSLAKQGYERWRQAIQGLLATHLPALKE